MPVGDDTFAFRRDLPHLQKGGKTHFVTFCTQKRLILPECARDTVLTTCVNDHKKVYWLHCAVIMPDHVHMLFTPFGVHLSTIMSRVKSTSAHRIGRGRIWQREYFDRVLRSDEDLLKKAEYILNNPVRAGLIHAAEQYRWFWRSAAEGGGAPLRS